MNLIKLQNEALEACIDVQGGKVHRLLSRDLQVPVLHENPSGALFPMLPVANRVADNRFRLHGDEVILPNHNADERFFLHGDGWLKRWDLVSVAGDRCVLRLRSRLSCGYDYLAELHYQLEGTTLNASLTITHLGEHPMLYGCGFHPFFVFDAQSTVQFSASGYWPEDAQHLPLAWQEKIPGPANFAHAQFGEDAWLNVGYSGWSGKAVIQRDVMRITLLAQTPWLMLFRMSGGGFLCLEPQSHPVNAHNMPGQPGLQVLARGESCHFAMQIIVE